MSPVKSHSSVSMYKLEDPEPLIRTNNFLPEQDAESNWKFEAL